MVPDVVGAKMLSPSVRCCLGWLLVLLVVTVAFVGDVGQYLR